MALSDALADEAAFADVRAASAEPRPRSRSSPASWKCSSRRSRRTRSTPICAGGSSSCRAASSRGSHATAARSTAWRSTTTRSSTSCAASTDRAQREAAWTASKSVGAEVAADVRRLVALRNEAARSLGYRDHFALTLATTDFDEDRLFATLAEVDDDHRGAVPGAQARARRTARGALRSRRRRGAPVVLRRSLLPGRPRRDRRRPRPVSARRRSRSADASARSRRWVSTSAPVVARSDLTPRPGKVQHAFCIDVDRTGDVRVLSNNTPGERWAETMLHEFGHAVYFDGVGRDLPWLLRTMHLCLTEGVAMRCGRLVRDPRVAAATSRGFPTTTVDEIAPRLDAARRAYLLVFARWVLVMTHFERGLYARTRRRPRHALVGSRRALPTRAPPRRSSRTRLGRQDPHLGRARLLPQLPVRRVGRVAAHGRARRPRRTTPQPGARWAPGCSRRAPRKRWDHLIEHATGAPLTPAAFAREIAV